MQKKLIKIEDHLDFVEIAGQVVHRPSYIGAGEWREFWEEVRRMRECY